MLTKDDIERAIDSAVRKDIGHQEPSQEWVESEAKTFKLQLSYFLQSLAIDEDRAVEEMARGIAVSIYHECGLETMNYAGEHDYANREWKHYETQAKAALHASPYYKLVKMMGEV